MNHPLLLLCLCMAADAPGAVDFAKDVQPILSDKCIACHGPDDATRKAKLRLDRKADALAAGAFVPGKPEESEAFQRVTADDDSKMPPAKSGKSLSAKDVDVLKRWIDQGAVWKEHWAFAPPVKARAPEGLAKTPLGATWPRSPIDAFVLDRLVRDGLNPSPEASKATLIRRLSLDLNGVPPTPAEVDAFLLDNRPDAYERLVDRLLASPRFGERMAMDWLDAARYSDTDGFQGDDTRTNWPWRDWVIDAFNKNMRFDRFTLEQFAGDLMPGKDPARALPTTFHRNHMTNGEGGRDPEESRIDYVLDRVNTVGTVWLGLTLGCAQCHTHKYDPISQADYYKLSAFFDSIDEDGKASKGARPYLKVQSPAVERSLSLAKSLVGRRKREEAELRKSAGPAFETWLVARRGEVKDGFRAWQPFMAASLETREGTTLNAEPDGTVMASGSDPRHEDYRLIGKPRTKSGRITGLRIDVLPHAGFTNGGYSRSKSGHFILTDIKVQVRPRDGSQVKEPPIAGAVADVEADTAKFGGYGKVIHTLDDDPRNGWSTLGRDLKSPHSAVYAFAEPLVLDPTDDLIVELRHRSTEGHLNIGRFRVLLTDQPGETPRGLEPSPLERLAERVDAGAAIEPKLRERLFNQYLEDDPAHTLARANLKRAESQLADLSKFAKGVDVMVLAEKDKPRDTHVLIRGVWDRKGDKVDRDVPGAVAGWPKDEPRTRAGLAKWLVSRSNPLTARVVVNRFWQMHFGAGIVRTPEDFGRQGEPPTHPEVLDWLAVEFMDSGWDVKHIIKTIVCSSTYRQSSGTSESLRLRDPENRLLARASRFRLPSWMIRDAALGASGLLNPAIGGPPVRPYQPPGVWEEMFMGRFVYEPTEGPDQYRRTIYAFWRRSAAPTFLFDSAQRRVCEVRTPRTNTPLQALTLLNDTTFLESARALAADAVSKGGDARFHAILKSVLARPADARELSIFQREFKRAREHFQAHPDDATRWLSHGQSRPDPKLDRTELAALAVVADMVLNLDEAITRE